MKNKTYNLTETQIHSLFLSNKMEHLNMLYKDNPEWQSVDVKDVRKAVLNDAREFSNIIGNVINPQELADEFLVKVK